MEFALCARTIVIRYGSPISPVNGHGCLAVSV
jgi:hypothetical protein